MSLWVLQISDLHFGQPHPPLPSSHAFPPLVEVVHLQLAASPAPLVVALCGDVVDKGDAGYYDTAARALETYLLKPLGSPAIVCCPGNHDVVEGENGLFAGFNSFAFRLTNKADITFDRSSSVNRVSLHDFDFVLANSMYQGHEDRKSGEINIEHLEVATRGPVERPRILLLHHSLISNQRVDTSTLVNTYPLLRIAIERGVVAILHGHLHSQSVFTVGRAQTAILGVGSILYRPWPNYNNGFNMVRFEKGVVAEALAFRYIADLSAGGVVGRFQKTALPLL